MRAGVLLFAITATAVWPASLLGQGRECDMQTGTLTRQQVAPGQIMLQFDNEVRFLCSDGTRLRADNGVQYEWLGQLQLNGNVEYVDAEQTLTADYLLQDAQQGTLFASGNVVLRDRKSGSVIRGGTFNHMRETDFFPARTYVSDGPVAVLGSSGRSQGAGQGQEPPTRVYADQMEISGDLFRANNSVRIERGEARGRSHAAEFHQDPQRDRMVLTGAAQFEDEGFVIAGDLIDAGLAEGELNELTAYGQQAMLTAREQGYDVAADTILMRLTDGKPDELIARNAASLKGEEIDVLAPRLLHLVFEDGELSRLVAMADSPQPLQVPGMPAPDAAPGLRPVPPTLGPPAPDPDGSSGKARVDAQGFLVLADSVDVLAPGGQLQELHAVGDVFARALPAPDPAAAAADSLASEALPELLAHDWVRGDTVLAYFATDTAAPPPAAASGAAADSTGDEGAERPRPELRQLVAIGGAAPASTLYRMNRDIDGELETTIHYVVAGRLIIHMRDGQVSSVEAIDLAYGRILEPRVSATTAPRRSP